VFDALERTLDEADLIRIGARVEAERRRATAAEAAVERRTAADAAGRAVRAEILASALEDLDLRRLEWSRISARVRRRSAPSAD